ncbi:beta-ketoacyl-ACP synthase III [Candidatus Desulforudis audaxviator]|uniref:Beta-ketoacyl-[acyl-carrier-protein] synthase III n=1 Tax=Desulforudis audaxviator (strain MP104C) TaxID=477974 RepID=B1I2C8_DESAP|nr:beta-ketoacyl-ACP synthase III [Candidatus Desulforudis audaxviator]ACA59173.1 3-oxoacyl-(acyl-carrier-protein) synthase III [Candidatus Desulforudis audaxviator MP104C]AZK59242.1 3-oxoacyl-[acyl-carrier-protein] synthase, KASIII [Candidatus Desulforudis audaxviator]
MAERISAGIVGIGSCVPERVLTNRDLEALVDTSDQWIRERTGIRERRIAGPDQSTSDLAVVAARRALADAGIEPGELDLIVVATATPDMIFPSTASLVQERLGCGPVAAFDLSAGCTGFMYGLVVGAQFIAAGTYRTVLVIGAETLSRILNWEDRSTCVLFGDGAGAVVLQPVPPGRGLLAARLGSDGSGGDLLKLPAGGSRLPASALTVEQKLHYVHMNGREVFRFAVRILGEAAAEVIREAGLRQDQIDLFIPHQANIRIIEAAAKRLDLPMDRVMVNVDRYGNTSSASIPLALEEAVHSGRLADGDRVVMVGFGAGLTWAAAVLDWVGTGRREIEKPFV